MRVFSPSTISHSSPSCSVHCKACRARPARQRAAVLRRKVDDRQVVVALQGCPVLLPPHVGDAAAVGQHHDLAGAAAGAADALFVGQADLDPQFDGAGQVLAPQVGFVFGGQALAEARASSAYMAKASTRTIMRSSVSDGCRATVSAWFW
jgi:hypothetical protein